MTNIQFSDINKFVRGNYSHLILFGSYSRGDYETKSDIDILQITDTRFKSYSVNHINFSVYTLSRLNEMCLDGSLFLLHIIKESKVLFGDSDILNNWNKIFPYKKDYTQYKNEIINTSKLLDVNEEVYLENWKGFNSLLCYLFRSYLYASLVGEKDFSFSTKYLADKINDLNIINALNLKKERSANYELYCFAKQQFEYYSNIKFTNADNSSLDLIQKIKFYSKLPEDLSRFFLNPTNKESSDY
ncbi:MAG: nucleotidyltransferase domain-containing protein [Chitinophagales bacterium]|nr:nucleotidyltransferase domain-containing protein [Chitinophagales bacterium]